MQYKKVGYYLFRSTLVRVLGDRLSELAYHIVQLSFISYYMLYVKKNMECFSVNLKWFQNLRERCRLNLSAA